MTERNVNGLVLNRKKQYRKTNLSVWQMQCAEMDVPITFKRRQLF